MNIKVGKPQGTTGTITFTTGVKTTAVRTEDGRYFVQSVNPNVWMPATIAPKQFKASA